MTVQPFAFKKTSSIVIEHLGAYRRLDVYPDFTFSQTFDEQAISVKTLHAQADMFDDAVINIANPANFSFTVPIRTDGADQFMYLANLLLQYDTASTEKTLRTCSIYVESNGQYFKLEKAVLERGTMQFSRDAINTFSFSGSAAKLNRLVSLPAGVLSASYNSTPNFSITRAMEVTIEGDEIPSIVSVTLEVINEVEWVKNNTLHKSLEVTGPSNTTYPEAFVVSKRNVTGTIVKYLATAEVVQEWSTSQFIGIQIGTPTGWDLSIDLPKVVITDRIDPQEVFLKSYDFRLIGTGPADLSTYFTLS